METVLVISYNINDFTRWLNDKLNTNIIPRSGVVIIDHIKYVKVTDVENLCGYMATRIEYTYTAAHFNDNFLKLMEHAQINLKLKPFKFGR